MASTRTTTFYVLLALSAVAATCIFGFFIAMFVFVKSNQKEFDAAFDAATKAPGAAELRAVGCQQALVMTPEVYAVMMKVQLADERMDPTLAVRLDCFSRDSLPDCPTVAKAFLSAPNRTPGTFLVEVRSSKVVCARRYSGSGEDLGELPR